jgi:hypothetical protein
MAILNPKWPPKYKNSPVWTKFYFHVDYQNIPRDQFALKSETIDKIATIANQRWILIRNIIIYLETKIRPNRRIFVFWGPFWIQNGRHSKPTMDINSLFLHRFLLLLSPQTKFEDLLFLHRFLLLLLLLLLLSPQTKLGDLLFLHRFLLLFFFLLIFSE